MKLDTEGPSRAKWLVAVEHRLIFTLITWSKMLWQRFRGWSPCNIHPFIFFYRPLFFGLTPGRLLHC